ncbi:galactosyltransferase [Campylobacter coli]|nr:galactosyltransferase [Campylobacter coli]ECP8734846.1 galactosyltransferase [Campylobacter coli]EDO6921840.1 galactosyltransferase [Campylobacter coli]EDO6948245.1 galactosyltransferase [Campylobacter coli]
MKRLAVQLYGHLRTYEYTYISFIKNIIKPNLEDGWVIDIFMHTWDTLSSSEKSWHQNKFIFNERKLLNSEIKIIKEIYNPKEILIEHLDKDEYGLHKTVNRVNKLREEYEKKHNIKYDFIIYTRPDVFFYKELKLSFFLQLYAKHIHLSRLGLPDNFIFCASGILEKVPLFDPRWTPANDLLWITKQSNGCVPNLCKNSFIIYLKYRLGIEFDIARPCDMISQYLLQGVAKQHVNNGYSAKTRIQNQLSYKLGQAMITNSKSLLGYIRMPFVLSYIKDKHKQEQKIYQEKIKKDPSLKLPPLESYPDYKEALKEKECLTYKLGEALIRANNNWYGGGYIKLLLEIRKLKKEFKKKANHA